MKKPKPSTAPPLPEGGDRAGRRDIDMKLRCRFCGRQGLRYRTKTFLCEQCCRARPALVKATGTADVREVVQHLARSVVEKYGHEQALPMLGLIPSQLDKALAGELDFAGAAARSLDPTAHSSDIDLDQLAADPPSPGKSLRQLESEIDPYIAWLMMRRHREFAPLDPATAALVRPWRRIVRKVIAREAPRDRARRETEAKARADLVRYVPRADAPLDPQKAGNAFGRVSSRRGTDRARFPFRIAIALWAMGFGAVRISRIAEAGGRPIGVSTISRMLVQSRRGFAGAVGVTCRALASEFVSRPFPRI